MFTLNLKNIYCKYCNIIEFVVYLEGNKSNICYYFEGNKSITK